MASRGFIVTWEEFKRRERELAEKECWMRWTSGKVNGQTDRGGHKETKEKEMQALIPRKQQRDRTTSKDKIVMGRETDDE